MTLQRAWSVCARLDAMDERSRQRDLAIALLLIEPSEEDE